MSNLKDEISPPKVAQRPTPIVLSFIGKLPSYVQECLTQIRYFHTGPIFLICNDLKSEYLTQDNHQVTIIPYQQVISYEFLDTVQKNKDRFCIVHRLKGRENLFIRSFERFFLLYNLMKHHKLENVIFLELDILIYQDPRLWVDILQKHTHFEFAYTYARSKLCCGGLVYVKQAQTLAPFLQHCLHFITHTTEFITEMAVLYEYAQLFPKIVGILPTIQYSEPESTDSYPSCTYQNQTLFPNSIFDAAGIGIFLFGTDPCHTEGKVQTGLHMFSDIDYSQFQYEFRTDSQQRKIPYISLDNKKTWLQINNLHIHSKVLLAALSK